MCLVFAAIFAACSDPPTGPTSPPTFSSTDLRLGTGAEAVNGAQVTVSYTVWLYDERQVDLKGVQVETNRGGQPFGFTIGSGEVIEGWNRGLPGMRVGGLRRLVVPSSLAYGGNRRGVIPPFATLVFEIELLSVG
jgi:FKBP-type peptidyl-prolyl cis-trans isomerase FkpA